MNDGRHILSNSRIRSFKTCPRKHYFEYVLGVRREPTEALRLGSAVHHGLDLLKTGHELTEATDAIEENYQLLGMLAGTPEFANTLCIECVKACRLVEGWSRRWQNADFEVVKSESRFDIGILNPGTNRKSTKYGLSGKIDAIIRLDDGRLAILEHKTTKEDISPGSTYWRHLKLDSQISTYFVAAKAVGYDVETVIYDVIRKPGIAPRLVPQEDADGNKIVLDAKGDRVFLKSGKPRQSAGEGHTLQAARETPEQYGARLAADIAQRPEWYYHRQEIPRGHNDIQEFKAELWQVQKNIGLAVRENRHYKNSDACFSPYPCAYFDVCTLGIDLTQETPEGFVRLDFVHPELLEDSNGHSSATDPNKTPAADQQATTATTDPSGCSSPSCGNVCCHTG